MFDVSVDVARIDLERVGQSLLFVRKWNKGYNPDNPGQPDVEEILDNQNAILPFLANIEALGFSVTMHSPLRASCLRGPVTRVDFVKQADGWHIKKYPEGWRAETRPVSDVVKTEDEVRTAIQWCRSHNWTVRETENIVRAWKGAPKPVHNAPIIRFMRSRASGKERFYDFAYDG